MNLRLCTLVVSLAMLALAGCGSTPPAATGTPVVDAGPQADTAANDAVKSDAVADTGAADISSADTGVDNAACCLKAKAKCGFVNGCPGNCGGCKAGEECDKALHKCLAVVELKKFGELCGPNQDCRPPANDATTAEKDEYRTCLNDQCEDGECFAGTCTKTCVMVKDVKNNATGASAADGVEDPDVTDSDCEGAVDGPAGAAYRCVQLTQPGQQQYQLCLPGTTFKACKSDGDCAGELCGYNQILGVLKTVCVPKYKSPDGSAGVGVSALCNDDPVEGKVATCGNNLCLGIGCVSFCKTDTDCITAPGACQAGKCSNGGAACTGDVDCSAWACKLNQPFFGATAPKASVCLPKPCGVDTDCKDPAFMCQTSYNGVKSAEGDPDPTDPSKVKMPAWENSCVKKLAGTAKKGESCDPYPNDDNTSVPLCNNPYWCTNGVCSSHCKSDTDCATNQKCGTVEIPLDLAPDGQPGDPETPSYDIFLPIGICDNMPSAAGLCYNQADCKTKGESSYCKPWEHAVSLAADATPVSYKHTLDGQCIKPVTTYKNIGESCGALASDGTDMAICKSGLCLGQSDTQPGFCADLCDGKASCPTKITIGGTDYKSVCRSLKWGWNGTAEPNDDIFVPVCLPTVPDSTLTDCSKDKTCGKGEICIAFAVATGPDKAAKMEYLCSIADAKQGTKKPGDVCDPDPPQSTPPECASGYCIDPDGTGKTGYCSALCNADGDCGTTADGMMCDTGHMYIPRSDPAKAAFLPLCLKKKSCTPCGYDSECVGGYLCANLNGAGQPVNQRCAPPCSSDADCKATDAGSKCEAAKDAKGKETGSKVCTPTCK